MPARSTSHSRSPGASTRTSPGAYRAPDTGAGKALMRAKINTRTSTRVPSCPAKLMTLGMTLKRCSRDILAYFKHPHTTGGPTEAINAPLEHLRGSAPGLPKPHPLHHPSTPRNRRNQTPTTPPNAKSREKAHYVAQSAECRIGSLTQIQGTCSSVLTNLKAAYVLLLHPHTLIPLCKLRAPNLQRPLTATRNFAIQAPDEAKWLRRIIVHRTLLTQEAIRRTIENCEHIEYNERPIRRQRNVCQFQAGPPCGIGIGLGGTIFAQIFPLTIYSRSEIAKMRLLHAGLTLVHKIRLSTQFDQHSIENAIASGKKN